MSLGSKANSTAGCTLQQIAANNTSLLVMQQKRCPNFDVFEAVFSNTPNVKPVSLGTWLKCYKNMLREGGGRVHVKRGCTSKTDQRAVAGRNETGKAVLFIPER